MNSEGAGWFHNSKHGEVCNADFSSNSKTNAAQHGLSVFHQHIPTHLLKTHPG